MKLKLTIAAALFAGLALPACVIHDDDDHHHDHYDDYDDYDDGYDDGYSPVYTTIDADHLLDTDLGQGAGVFVEYAVGGRWTVWTSCDTDITGLSCLWDVQVTALKSPVTDIFEFDTEGTDFVAQSGDNSFTFYPETSSASDAVEFYTDPGALVEIAVVLDGFIAPEYVVWFGNGTVHNGAAGSPIVFQPDQP